MFKTKVGWCVYICLALCSLFIVSNALIFFSIADVEKESGVLGDLQKDEAFDVSNYPVIENDYSLEVIHIAETTSNELVVYVYQPACLGDELHATSINISTTINENFAPKNYSLKLLDESGVFSKYLVEGLAVESKQIRYYEIVSVYRKWVEGKDEAPPIGNEISEVSFEVGCLWTALTFNGEVLYSCEKIETIQIVDKFVGHVQYSEGFTLFHDPCDSHFVAFSTDKKIDKLLSASVSYSYTPMAKYYGLASGWHYVKNGKTKSKTVDFNASDKAEYKKWWNLFSESPSWNRIESVDKFKKGLDKSKIDYSDFDEEISSKQWVLRFAETKYDSQNLSNYTYYTKLEDVSILTLTFQTDGVTYKLGVVDCKQSGSDEPINKPLSLWEKIKSYLIAGAILLFVVFLVYIFWDYIPVICKSIFACFKNVVKGIVWLFKSPFDLFLD